MSRPPRLRIPSSVPILGVEYQVLHRELPKGQFGENPADILQTIYVDKKKHENQDQLNNTLLHESIHAILYVSGIASILEQAGHDSLEEGIVVALEHGLSQIYDITIK
jgi:hypothetical protein